MLTIVRAHITLYDDAMDYEEFRRHLGKAGLTVSAFAEIVKMNKVSLSNYRNKNVPSHLAIIATLLGAMADGQTDFRDALSSADIVRKKPRGAGFEKCVDVKEISNC